MTAAAPRCSGQSRLIAFSGIDGAGKSSLLVEVARGLSTRHPELAVLQRKNDCLDMRRLLDRQLGPRDAAAPLSGPRALCNALAGAFDWLRFAEQQLAPALGSPRPGVVLLDRYRDCVLAHGLALDPPCEGLLEYLLAPLPRPSLIIHVIVPPQVAWRRLQDRAHASKPHERLELLQRLEATYARVFAGRPDVVTLDNDRPLAQSATEAVRLVCERLRLEGITEP